MSVIHWLSTALILCLLLTGSASGRAGGAVAPRIPIKLETGSLEVAAGLIFKSGDAKPVARLRLEIYDANIEPVLREAKPGAQWATLLSHPALEIVRSKFSSYHLQGSMATDFNGHAELKALPVGDYFLFGYRITSGQLVVWNLPIRIRPGSTMIILDNDNATFIDDPR